MLRQYIGARYTPKFMGEYDATTSYENLCVVDNGAGTTYISKKPVPPNTALTNTEYWQVYGASSGAILDLQTRMGTAENDIDNLEGDVSDLQTRMGTAENDIDNLESDVSALETTDGKLDDIYKRLKGKTIIVLGDSLTMGQDSWCELLASRYGATVYNYSVSGSSIADSNDATSMISRITSILTNHDTCDYFILSGGANDKNHNIPLGNTTTTNTDYFIGAIASIAKLVLTKYGKDVKLRFITTYHRLDDVNTLGLNEASYVEAMLRCCAWLSIPCFNAYANAGVELTGNTNVYNWADKGLAGGGSRNYHLSTAGYAYVLPKFAEFIAYGSTNNDAIPMETFNMLTMHSDLTIQGNRSFAIGRLVVISLKLKATADIAGYTTLFKTPYAGFGTDIASGEVVGTLFDFNTNEMNECYLTNSIEVRTHADITNNHTINVNIIYARR